jgi:MFS family permease
MNEAVGAVLAFAVGVGISPIPIVAVILVLFSERAKVNGPLFLIGWLVGLTGLFIGFFLLADALDLSSDRDTQDRVSWLLLALGLMLVVAAVRKLRTHPDRDAEPMMPGWMTRLDHIGFVAIGSVVSCVAVVYYLIGGERARARLDTMKS